MTNKIKRVIRKWFKWLIITISSFLVIILILAIIYSEIAFRLLSGVGYLDVYNGNNERGNKIMKYAISKMKNPDTNVYHALSVQNTKNGNYDIAISALDKAYEINPNEVGAYYGWVLLYYYHDYEKALKVLNKYDDNTPDFSDAPMGEDIHYLKGLAYMQLKNYENAIKEFDISITNISERNGEDWVDIYTFVNKGRCLAKLHQFEEAIRTYLKAIKYYDKCAEAYYFMGIAQISINQNVSACQNLNTALNLVKNGYKSSDAYIEFFHEIYEQQIVQSIFENCTNK